MFCIMVYELKDVSQDSVVYKIIIEAFGSPFKLDIYLSKTAADQWKKGQGI